MWYTLKYGNHKHATRYQDHTKATTKQTNSTPEQPILEIDEKELAEFKRWQEAQKEAQEPTRTLAGKIPASVFKKFDQKVKKKGMKKWTQSAKPLRTGLKKTKP